MLRWESGLVVLLACLIPSAADADWLLALYAGAAATSTNTVTIAPSAGASVTVSDVRYEGRSWESPIYYGYRIGWAPGGRRLGVEAEFTHAKSIATRIDSTELTALQLSHGLNFILGNIAFRTAAGCGGRCAFVARAGAGITVPHVEATFRGRDTFDYQYGGIGEQVGGGVEIFLAKNFFAVMDVRLTHARVRIDLSDAKLSGPFTSRHADLGIAWRFR